ncbi:hypothetical protein N7510_005842 [Penicillium lagena]|uniref:uncharacterized protein n=1 Tax=Penicillium lagena TaxID=94218 RepID=UPI002540DC9A|nr:uncharacterized protein N7510_005842 [Penicillium lagena]KAJ5612648.1 hypothetical protein N7510_005842 [Penicillium lagena]
MMGEGSATPTLPPPPGTPDAADQPMESARTDPAVGQDMPIPLSASLGRVATVRLDWTLGVDFHRDYYALIGRERGSAPRLIDQLPAATGSWLRYLHRQ